MSQGLLLVNVMGCTRLTELPSDCRLYCTLSVGRYLYFREKTATGILSHELLFCIHGLTYLICKHALYKLLFCIHVHQYHLQECVNKFSELTV